MSDENGNGTADDKEVTFEKKSFGYGAMAGVLLVSIVLKVAAAVAPGNVVVEAVVGDVCGDINAKLDKCEYRECVKLPENAGHPENCDE